MLKEILENLSVNEKFDTVGFIMDFEGGEITNDEMVKGFAELTKVGLVWKLQGTYGRTAQDLIDNGYIDKKGKVLKLPSEED